MDRRDQDQLRSHMHYPTPAAATAASLTLLSACAALNAPAPVLETVARITDTRPRQDDVRLAWPDGFALGPNNTLYVTQNQLFAHPALNEGKDDTTKPFHVLKIKLPAITRR